MDIRYLIPLVAAFSVSCGGGNAAGPDEGGSGEDVAAPDSGLKETIDIDADPWGDAAEADGTPAGDVMPDTAPADPMETEWSEPEPLPEETPAADLEQAEDTVSESGDMTMPDPGCQADCAGKTCGPNGCGSECPPGCGAGFTCESGQCKPDACVPACTGKTCGPDGCGGKCPPGCPAGQTCSEGACGKTCVHSYGGLFANGGCSPSYQCCDGTWKKGNEVCGPCTCKESTGKAGCMPEDEPPPPPPEGLSFVVYGDTQFATTSCTSGIPERLAVPKAIAKLSPTFVLHTGDLMDHGYEDGAYAQFQECSDAMVSKDVFFPTAGNHDMGSGGILAYRKYLEGQLFTKNKAVWGAGYAGAFDMAYEDDPATYSTDFDKPGDKSIVPSGVSFETFYAVRHENVYIISFEQGTRWWTNTPKPWVEKHLQKAHSDPSVDHVIVLMHHPMYSTTMPETDDSECIQPVRKHYEAMFRKYDVTMVFAGHAHLYEHFFVPDDGSPTKADPHPATYVADGSAIHYFVTGGGGGPLNSCPAPIKEISLDYSQGRFCKYHVIQVKLDGKKVTVNAIVVKGNSTSYTTEVADTFTMKTP